MKSDYSTIAPHYSKPYVIPSAYSVEEIKQIEESVGTSTVLARLKHIESRESSS